MSYRPSRKYKNLLKKLEEKKRRSRLRGKKAKRYAKWAAKYEELANAKPASS
ncbi:MAG: hypothetical protein AAGA56_18775 [Myxococcota bacterium]